MMSYISRNYTTFMKSKILISFLNFVSQYWASNKIGNIIVGPGDTIGFCSLKQCFRFKSYDAKSMIRRKYLTKNGWTDSLRKISCYGK